MGARPVSARKPSSWCLLSPHDGNTQGIVVNGFNNLEAGRALFLQFTWPDAPGQKRGGWLAALNAVAGVTDAKQRKPDRAANVAFTCTGLKKMGLAEETLATFSAPFREGMYQEDRLRRLGDNIAGAWQNTVIAGGPRWGGNTAARQAPVVATVERSFRDVGPREPDELQASTPITVHALLLLYADTAATAESWAGQIIAAIAGQDVDVVHQLPLDLRKQGGFAREHFGFADGLSQPIPYDEKSADPDLPDAVAWSDGSKMQRDPVHGIPLGEILLGHVNGHHEKAPAPMVRVSDDPAEVALARDGVPEGFLNLGIDGSYMVVRELKQDVTAFWKSMEEGAELVRQRDPNATHVTPTWLAERIIGRTLDGDMFRPRGKTLPKAPNGEPANDFLFRKEDQFGLGCPLGSHVRRANPRDSLADALSQADTLLDAANNHRILRRGRKYGTTLDAPYNDDGTDRGLLFICLNTDIARQFEFVQQTWLLNTNFHTLFDETDPLVGPKGQFTLPEEPLRRRVAVETFIKMVGGEYFFLPSIAALNYLALK